MAWRSVKDARWRTVAGWSLVLLIAAIVPSPFERRPSWRRFGPDKVLHFVGYGVYAVALVRAMDRDQERELVVGILSVCTSMLYGHLLGKLQTYVPGRRNESADTVAAIAGAVVFVVGWYRSIRSNR